MVEITGEAYLEVAKDAKRPFIVKAGDEKVEVLGTSFNIMAYPDEPAMQTTLINGKIKVSRPDQPSAVMRPGQQAVMRPAGIAIREVDTQPVVAWVHGTLSMKNLDVPAFMRQVSRWYDIDVEFKGPVPEMTFSASFSRMVNLRELLEALNENGIQAVVENGKLVISRK